MDVSLRDPVSSLTHLGTSLFAVYVTAILCRLAGGDRAKRWSLFCFGASAVVLYGVSGFYHAIPLPRSSPLVQAFRRLDHSAIYILIAGTYTPVFAVLLRGRMRVIMLILVWTLAAAGVASKWLWRVNGGGLDVGLYLATGWLGVIPAATIVRTVGWSGLAWIGAGGLCYTAGAICDLTHWPVLIPGVFAWHEVFHLFDMAGTAFHVGFMIHCVVPYRPPRLALARAA